MRDRISVGRRRFLRTLTVTGGGFLVGFSSIASFNTLATRRSDVDFSPFIRISPDNTVTTIIKHLDKGQGVTTGLTSVVAEELGASWEQMRWEFAPADAALYGNLAWGGKSQGTGGSNSMRNSWQQLRTTAAATRELLLEAGSLYLKVEKSSLKSENGLVIDKNGRSVTFGSLVDLAMSLQPPQNPQLKKFSKFKTIGLNAKKPLSRIDSREKTTGVAQYTIDFQAQGLLAAVVEHPPLFGAVAKNVNRTEVENIEKVEAVFTLSNGAVAVVATDHWSAIKARDALKVEWDKSIAEKRSNDELVADYRERNKKPGAIASSRGDVSILTSSDGVIEAEFVLPFLAHASMEPLNAVARFHDGRLDIWSGCQSQTRDQSAAAAMCNIAPENVHIHTRIAGGSFGRRASIDSDYLMETVEISKLLGRPNPVRLQWTRENDMRGGRYRPLSVHKMRGLADDVGIVGWHHRIATQSFVKDTPMAGIIKNGVDRIAVEGARNLPYRIENFQCELHITDAAIPTLWWRSVGHSYNAYVTEVFFDILARSKGHDPVTLRRSLLAGHPKHLAVLNKALSAAGAKRSEIGRGVAIHESFQTVVAQVADVIVTDDGNIEVERVTCAVDCGFPVNPDVIRAQMEGGIGYGLSAAMRERITIVNGQVRESNFHDYKPLRIGEMPEVSVHIVESDEPPTGVGEPGTPPIAPAVANAVFSVTGAPITTLPFFES